MTGTVIPCVLLSNTPKVYGIYRRNGKDFLRKYRKEIKGGLNEADRIKWIFNKQYQDFKIQ